MFFGLLAGACLTCPAIAHAEDPPPVGEAAAASRVVEGEPAAGAGERTTYTPEDFTRFSPRSALDMLRQIPGFTIDDPLNTGNNSGFNNNNEEVRGLGQASGNVLLNGQRFTSKSDSITNQLARIAAEDVVRIELVDGATLDLPGLSGRVANVIAETGGGLSGQVEWKGELRGKHSKSTLQGLVASLTGSSGSWSFVLALANDPFNGGADGFNIVTHGDGTVEHRTNSIRPKRRRPKVNGSVRYEGAGGWVANVSATYREETFSVTEPETWLPTPGATVLATDIVRTHSPEEVLELGADVAFDLAGGRLTIIGLLNKENDEFFTEAVVDRANGTPPTGTRFLRIGDASEKILRAEYNWAMLGGTWQLSGEGAYNRLDQTAELSILSPLGEFVAAPFPSGTGIVEEDRYEVLLFHGRPLSGSLTLQVTAGGEYSSIDQSGSNALTRTFLRPKGSAGLAWTPKPGMDISLTLAREVGQLDFDDILADVNLGNSNTNAGNNELRPEQKWVAELAVAKNFGPWGSATVTLFGNRITDYVTIVPLDGGGESTGNIPSAREYGVKLTGTLRLDPLGIRGAKFDVDGKLRTSSLTDPVTGASRGFDKYEPRKVLVKFRYDLPNTDWAWGGEYEFTHTWPYYRVAESGLEYNRRNDLHLFIEHKNIFGMTGQFSVRNVLHSDVVLIRTLTTGPRNVAPLLFSEDRRREVGKIWNFSLKGSF